ncbi:MAG: hypothetical protein V1848_01630 [Candidatus Magasanikbacteria bacterium]
MEQEQILDKILVEVLDIKGQLKDKPSMEYVDEKFDVVLNSVDRFVKLHETLDIELAALRNKYNRLEERLVIIEEKLQVV